MVEFLLPLVLPIALLLLFFFFYLGNSNWRYSFLSAAVIWGVLLTAITETLSLLHLVNRKALFGSWMIMVVAIAIFLLWRYSPVQFVNSIRTLVNDLVKPLRSHTLLGFSLISLILILVISGFLALNAAPNTWDSMTYHMSRVANWLQQQSVEHYLTHNLRQLDQPPWANFAILHLQSLSRGDRLANLVQWFSMIGSLIGVSLIAQQLGANLAGQIMSSVICASIPMGLLQSVTTQNDYVVSFWLVCFTWNVLLISKGQVNRRICFEAGASLGLAILTKATAYVYAFPLCLFGFATLVQYHFKFLTAEDTESVCEEVLPKSEYSSIQDFLDGIKNQCLNIQKTVLACYYTFQSGRFWCNISFIALPIVFLNSGHVWRNIELFGSPLGSSQDATKNELFTPAAILSNLIRNIALHAPVANQSINDFLEKIIIGIHQMILGLDVNDPRTTFLNSEFQLPVTPKNQPIFLNEDLSGNPIHLILIFLVIILYLLKPRLRTFARTSYLLVLLTISIVFCILVAWQPWATRLHLPFFVLISAFLGCLLVEIFCSSFWFSIVLTFVLTLSSFPYLCFSASRPLMSNPNFLTFTDSIFSYPRIERYFINRPGLRKPYTRAVRTVRREKCDNIGLYIGGDSWEYPFWALSWELLPRRSVTIQSVRVGNLSVATVDSSQAKPLPCAVIATEREDAGETLSIQHPITNEEVLYLKAEEFKTVSVYLRS